MIVVQSSQLSIAGSSFAANTGGDAVSCVEESTLTVASTSFERNADAAQKLSDLTDKYWAYKTPLWAVQRGSASRGIANRRQAAASERQAAISLRSGSAATITHSSFAANGGHSAGALLVSDTGTVANLNHVNFMNNHGDAPGAAAGAIFVIDNATVTAVGGSFDGNAAASQYAAGAIYARQATVTLSDLTFVNSEAQPHESEGTLGGGGALYTDGSTVNIARVTAENNAAVGSTAATASNYGDAFNVQQSQSFVVTETTFTPLLGVKTVVVMPGIIDNIVQGGCVQNPCEAGQSCSYRDYSLSCNRCPVDKYSSDGITCQYCEPGQGPNAEQTACVCQDEFYDATLGPLICYDLLQDFDAADFPQAASNGTDRQCRSCAELEYCVTCADGIAQLKPGYALGKTAKTARAQTPLSVGVIAPAAIFKCPMEGCLGTTESSLSQCEQGYGGPLCSVCSANRSYIKEGASCIECKHAASTPMTAVAIAIAAVVTVLLTLRCLGSSSNDRCSVVMAHIGFMVQAKILIGLFQVTVELPFTLNLIYPEAFMSVLSAVRVIVVDVFAILKVECLGALSVHAKFMLVMALPIVCVVIIYLIRCVSDCRISGKDMDRQRDENRITAAYRTFFVVFLLYPLLSRTVFRTFDCQTLYEDTANVTSKELWHVDDYSVDCSSDSHKTFQRIAWVFVVLYPIGIPLVFLLLLWRDDRHRKQSKHVLGSASSFDFLRRDYKDDYYFFEVVVLLEKLLLTGILTFIDQGSVLQAFAGTCIAFFFCCLQCRVCPYRERSDNLLKACAEGQLFVTLLISIILRTQLDREHLTPDEYGTILVAAFFATPAMEVLLVLLKMCGCCPAAPMPTTAAEDGIDSRVDPDLVAEVRPAFLPSYSLRQQLS